MAARVSDELSEKDQEELTEEVWELIRVFKNDTRNFKCKRILGEGSYGVALLFQEDDAAGVPKRLFCAKCASADDSLEDLEREIQATEVGRPGRQASKQASKQINNQPPPSVCLSVCLSVHLKLTKANTTCVRACVCVLRSCTIPCTTANLSSRTTRCSRRTTSPKT